MSLLVWGCLACVVNAQDEPEKRTVKLRFACLDFLANHRAIKIDQTQTVRLHLRHPSDEKKVVILNDTLFLYKEQENFEETPIPLGRVRIPKTKSKGIILLSPREGKYEGLFINDADAPVGGIYILNYSGEDLGITVSGKPAKVSNRKAYTFKPSSEGSHSLAVRMYGKDGEGTWRDVYSTKWRLVANRREILILLKHPKNHNVMTKGISQYVSLEPKK